jgi:hypothetical protein
VSTVKPVDAATNGDEEVGVWEIPKVMLDDDGRGIWVNRSYGSVENGFKKGRHGMVVQVKES